jgi:hypothetical protein
MKFVKQIITLILFSVATMIMSCTTNSTDGTSSEVSFAPENIVGKALILYTANKKVLREVTDFTSSGTCMVKMIASCYSLTSTPSYSYNNDGKEVTFYLYFTEKLKVGSDYTNYKYTYDLEINFSDSSSGSYKGTEKIIKSGNVTSNSTTTESISGTFSLD